MRSILPKGENRKRRSIAARAIACVLVALLALPFAGCSASPNATGGTAGSQEYTVSVSLSGGSGRASIASPTTIVKDGDTYTATITWSSSNYDKMTVNGEHMREVLESDFSNATDMADYLAKKGLPFREAHAVVGKAVHYCIEQGKVLQQLSLSELQAMSPLFAEDIHHYLDIETCVKQRNTYNGTSPTSVARQCKAGRDTIAGEQTQIGTWDDVVSSVYELLK